MVKGAAGDAEAPYDAILLASAPKFTVGTTSAISPTPKETLPPARGLLSTTSTSVALYSASNAVSNVQAYEGCHAVTLPTVNVAAYSWGVPTAACTNAHSNAVRQSMS
jgi:hypothetical protein